MILYHFTSYPASADIIGEGVIRPHRSAVGSTCGPVVWFTADPDREQVYDTRPFDPDVVIGTAIRFTVNLPDSAVLHWRDWVARHGKGKPLAECDPALAAYKAHWYVTERGIPETEWVSWDWAVTTEAFVAALTLVAS